MLKLKNIVIGRIKNADFYRLFLISWLILFLELLVIRLVSTEIRIFAYLSNLVLLATFIGSSLGMSLKKKYPVSLSVLLLFITTALIKFRYIIRLPNLEFNLFSGITELLAPLSEAHIWLQIDTFSLTGIIIGLLLTVLLFSVIAGSFIPLGQMLGQILETSPRPILTYSINIFASLLGMWTFQLFSLLGLSPFLGLFLGQLLLLLLIINKLDRLLATAAIIGTLVLLLPQSAYQPFEKPVTFWSPYQKITLSLMQQQKPYQSGGWLLEVNNVYHMTLMDLSKKELDKNRLAIEEFFKDKLNLLDFFNQYSLPYKFNAEPHEVLIIGGGGGNDVAAAIRAGASSIDVVEIDPTIISLGKKYHPEKPYSQSQVTAYVNDGRAFLETANKKYDLIIMSLADSHTLSSSLTNLRLDHYLYTRESFLASKNLLKDDGLFFISFAVGRPWIGARLKNTLTDVFNATPRIFEIKDEGVFGFGATFFVSAKNPSTLDNLLQQKPKLTQFIEQNRRDYNLPVKPLTDDWPYLYLDKPRLPLLHLLIALLITGGLVTLRKKLVGAEKFNWGFFCLGIAFLLFEFQNVSKSSLIFGNTWTTNLWVITGVLSTILLANLAVYKKLVNLKLSIVLLFISLLVQLLLPINFFNHLSGITKVLTAMLFLSLPHFFSGAIFISLFARAKHKAQAFGSNLLGSAVGGLFEMFSFLFGINSLLYFVIAFYGLGLIYFKLPRAYNPKAK